MTFGAALRRHRIAAGLTQEQLAERAGLSVRGIQDLERGARRSPHPETVRRLSEALGQSDTRSIRLPNDVEPRQTAPRSRAALPVAMSSFVGRERDVREVAARIQRARLVTLTGTGGIGKTRLSLEVAAAVARDFDDGVALAELGSIADDDLVVRCVAAACGVREQFLKTARRIVVRRAGRSIAVAGPRQLRARARRAARRCSTRCCARALELRVLATSREPLRVEGEAVWRVPPLQVPDLACEITDDTLAQHDATRLFLERAAALSPDLALGPAQRRAVAIVCARLDGVPLSIELAAARTSVFSVEQIAERLDDAVRLLSNGSRVAPARHQTLRATLDWSYGLLDEREQVLLDRLTIFAGGFSLEAAETWRPGMGSRAATSWSRSGDWSTSRSSWPSRVPTAGCATASRRCCASSVRSAIGSARRSRSMPCASDTRRITWRSSSTRSPSAWAATVDCGSIDSNASSITSAPRGGGSWRTRTAKRAQRLCASLYRLLVYRGHANEGRAALREALALGGAESATRARALHFLGSLAWTQGDFRAAVEHQREGLVLRRQIGDEQGIVWSLAALGIASTMMGDLGTGEILLEEARAAGRSGDDRYISGLTLSLSALTAYLGGQRQPARAHAQEALAVANEHGLPSIRCMALTTLGTLHFLDGDVEVATNVLENALHTAEGLGEVFLTVRAAMSLAAGRAAAGQLQRARSLLAQGVSLAHQMGNRHSVAQALEGVAAFVADSGDRSAALCLVDAAAAIRTVLGAPLSPMERSLLERRLGHSSQRARAKAAPGRWTRLLPAPWPSWNVLTSEVSSLGSFRAFRMTTSTCVRRAAAPEPGVALPPTWRPGRPGAARAPTRCRPPGRGRPPPACTAPAALARRESWRASSRAARPPPRGTPPRPTVRPPMRRSRCGGRRSAPPPLARAPATAETRPRSARPARP